MATTKAIEMRRMTDAELRGALDDAKQEIFNLRIQWEIGQLEDYTRIRELKKEIARLKTVQRERELAAQFIQEEIDAQ
jgi:large subunit ribosomal protein L29